MFAFFRRFRRAGRPFPAIPATRARDVVLRHQIECGPFNTPRRLFAEH